MRQRLLAALVTLAFISTPAFGQKTGGQFMWKVEGPGGSSAYLLGSLHVLTADFYPLNATINRAFAESKMLVEEIDIDETSDPMVMMAALSKAMLTDGRTLDQIIAPDVYAEVKKRAEKAGMPMAAIQRMKPWLVAITLMGPTLQAAGFKPELGIDRHFYDRAKIDGKRVQGLETVDYQLSLFDQMTNEEQDRMLAESLKDVDREQASVITLTNAWKAGDTATVERIVLDDVKGDPVMYERLLVNRNRNWLPTLDALLNRKGRAFVVVGAAHLVGPDGLLAMFKAKGYKVEQL